MLKKLFYLATLLVIPTSAFATPNPTSYSLSGSAYGSELRVNGTGFGTKPTQKADAWYPFDSIFKLQPSTWGIITSGGTQNIVWVTSGPALPNASGFMKYTWCESCVDAGGGNPYGVLSGGAYLNKAAKWSQVDDSGFRYHDFSVTANQKLWRLNPGPSAFVVSTSGSGCCFNEGCAGVGTFDNIGGVPNGVWNFEEHHYKNGDTDNGEWEYRINGVVRQFHNNRDDCGLDSDELRVWDNFADNADAPPDGSVTYQAGILVDSTRVRIIISTNSTWTASVVRVPQVPKQHSSTSTVCYFNDIGLDKTKQCYLYMVDDTGDVNANGLPITLGGSSGGTVLNPQFTGVTTSSATASWGLVGSNTYNVVFATSSDFATPITSGTTTNGTTTFTSLSPGTTYMVQVKISTEDAASYTAGSTVTSRTNLRPTASNITHNSMTWSWDSLGGSYSVVLATSSNFTVPSSSGTLASNTTDYSNLSSSTLWYFEVKPSSDGASGYAGNSASTNAPPAGGSAPYLPNIRGSGWIKGPIRRGTR